MTDKFPRSVADEAALGAPVSLQVEVEVADVLVEVVDGDEYLLAERTPHVPRLLVDGLHVVVADDLGPGDVLAVRAGPLALLLHPLVDPLYVQLQLGVAVRLEAADVANLVPDLLVDVHDVVLQSVLRHRLAAELAHDVVLAQVHPLDVLLQVLLDLLLAQGAHSSARSHGRGRQEVRLLLLLDSGGLGTRSDCISGHDRFAFHHGLNLLGFYLPRHGEVP